MSQSSTLLTVLMDRKTHSREELLSLVYKKVRGTHSGRLAARVDDLRHKGFEIESPKVRYVNGKKVLIKSLSFRNDQRSFWYKLKGSKTVWKGIEEAWQERIKRKIKLARWQANEARRKAKLLEEESYD